MTWREYRCAEVTRMCQSLIPDSMLEITLKSGAVAMVSNLVVGNKGATRIIWVGEQRPTEEDIGQITDIVRRIVTQVGGRPGTPLRFSTKDQMEALTLKHLGGGKG